jgi:hypothetical protein
MTRTTGLSEAEEWELTCLFVELQRAVDRRYDLQFEGLTRVVSRDEYGRPDGRSEYACLTAGPITVLGLGRVDYIYVEPDGQFEGVVFAPRISDCQVYLTPPGMSLSPTRIYADDPGPWWSILARALPVWRERLIDALLQAEAESGRGEKLARVAVACDAYLKREEV